jgi:lipopolysaccharide export system protein LptA
MIAGKTLSALTFAFLVAGSWAQQKPKQSKQIAQSQPSKQADKDTEFLDISCSSFNQSDATGEGEYAKFVAVDKDTTVIGDLCKLHDKKKVAEATGNLKITDPQADATGDKALVYYAKSKKLLVITGNVLITVKPKEKSSKPGEPAAASGAQPKPVEPTPAKVEATKAAVQPAPDDNDDSSRKYPAVITCDKAEYYYAKDKKHGFLTGNFKVVQTLPKKTRTLTADHGEWFGKEDKIILFPPVHFEDTEGTTFEPVGEVTLFTKEGEERVSMSKGGKGHIIVKDDEEDKEKKPEKKKPQ